MSNKRDKCLLSVATYRYLPRAFVLADSFLSHNPGHDVLLLAPDLSHEQIHSVKWTVPPRVKIISLGNIQHPLLRQLHQYFDAFEICCAAKSFLLEHALFNEGYLKAAVLDPDIVCYAGFEAIWSALDKADIAVTPHVNSPLPSDNCLPDDREFINAGFINGGFWAAARTEATKQCLDWIKEKVTHFGFFIPQINLYADQTWMSCLPWFFPQHTAVLRNPGLNVAYWNLHERTLAFQDGKYFSSGERLVFFHMSGYNEMQGDRLTTHSERTLSGDVGRVLKGLVDDYATRLAGATQRLPLLKPEKRCCTLSLERRFQAYQSVHGGMPPFAAELGNSWVKCVPFAWLRRLKRYLASASAVCM